MASTKNKGLGKGLGAIFGDDIDTFIEDVSNGSKEVKGAGKSEIAIKDVRANPYQPRKDFDEEGLQELAASIKENGVFQPILVRKATVGNGYELVAGERRLRASKLAGKRNIPAIIMPFDDKQMMEIALLENIQRKDLTPIEEANAYDQLIRKLKDTQYELAKRLGKSRANITNLLRLLKLPKEIQEMVNKGQLSYGQARTLLSLSDESKMIEVAEKTIREDLSVRELEKICSKKPQAKKPAVIVKRDPFIEDVRDKMQKKYGTKVEIGNKSINIKYTDNDDLNRILEIMGLIEE